MLRQVRLSLGERLVESTIRGHVCIRRIHAQKPIRGAAAQAQQTSPLLSGMQYYQASPSAQDKRHQQNDPLPPSKSAGKSSSKTNSKTNSKNSKTKPGTTSNSVRLPEGNSANGDPRETANFLNSPHSWGRQDIIKLYEPPTEEEIPLQLERPSKSGKRTITYNWAETPLEYLVDGLKLGVKQECVNIRRREGVQHVRVKLDVYWSGNICSAVGDGTNRVLKFLKICLLRGNCGKECSLARNNASQIVHRLSTCSLCYEIQKCLNRNDRQ